MNKSISAAAAVSLTLSAALIFLAAGFYAGTKYSSTATHAPAVNEVPCQAEEEHHDHDHASEEVSLEELGSIECEHCMPAVSCDECRFEVGVVKIDTGTIAPLIETGVIEEIDRTKRLDFTGSAQLDSTATVEVVPAGSGRIERIEKFIGEEVQKGDVLAVIHSVELGQAKAQYLEVSSALGLANSTFEREKELYEKNITSRADFLAAQNKLSGLRASLTAVDKRLRLFGLEEAQIAAIKDEDKNGTFADLIIRAPQAGTILAMDACAGQIIEAEQSICRISDLSALWVWCDVYEKDLAFLLEQTAESTRLEASVKVKAFAEQSFSGVVDYVGDVMDEHTRTVKMRVRVDNPQHKLRAGMFASVGISVPQAGKMLAVLKTAVLEDEGEKFLFRHWKDDLWVRRDVETGEEYGEHIELLSGAPAGTRVVTGGAFMLKSDVLREKMGAGCAD